MGLTSTTVVYTIGITSDDPGDTCKTVDEMSKIIPRMIEVLSGISQLMTVIANEK
jgi:hypothetical protein